MKGHLFATTNLPGNCIPVKSKGVANSSVSATLSFDFILSIYQICLTYSTGGLASPLSPYKNFLRVNLLITLNPTSESYSFVPIPSLNAVVAFAIVSVGFGCAPSFFCSKPSAFIGTGI